MRIVLLTLLTLAVAWGVILRDTTQSTDSVLQQLRERNERIQRQIDQL